MLQVFAKPVSWMVFIIYALSFMVRPVALLSQDILTITQHPQWAVGINITSSILFSIPRAGGGYGFSLRTISFLYFTPLVGLAIGEAIGHWANDAVAARYIRKQCVTRSQS